MNSRNGTAILIDPFSPSGRHWRVDRSASPVRLLDRPTSRSVIQSFLSSGFDKPTQKACIETFNGKFRLWVDYCYKRVHRTSFRYLVFSGYMSREKVAKLTHSAGPYAK